ncbi:MAG TPA: zinc-binding dehydrogenase [Candidatus Baltobacteraceae bacterium]|nr:zinc-binding dehydrogenase [Candidatus Baltobacteraceae bacterium]
MLRSPVHNHDLATIRGVYGVKPELPATGGSELVGIVDRINGEAPLSAGARVACMTQGAWAEFAIAPLSQLVPIPDGISDDAACQLLAMPLSALVLLDELHVDAGDWIAQNAASGAVGRILMQEAQRRGVHVINLVRREEARRELERFGAKHVVVTSADWTKRVLEMAAGAPISRVVDSVAGNDSIELARLLAPGGELIVFGGLGGQAMRLDPGRLISHELTVRGFWMTAWMRRPENAPRVAAAMQRVFALALGGDLPLPVGGVYSLSQVREALTAAETPGRAGKMLFTGKP